jgi:hypothetical protein
MGIERISYSCIQWNYSSSDGSCEVSYLEGIIFYYMRITIKSLQEQLAQSETDKKRYYNLWQEAKGEIENKAE